VIRLWSGLGYNRRGLNLRASAVALLERHGGEVPASLDDLLGLPGVGPYTARAVLAFAFGAPVAPVDTNIARVFARAVAGAPLSRGRLQAIADQFADTDDSRAWNLALMDLGSLVCRARRPTCDVCPLLACCRWQQSGQPSTDPAPATAATSRPQSRFAGSDREGRGRLLRALCIAPIEISAIARVAGWPDDAARAARVTQGLLSDGLAVRDNALLRLP